MSALVDSMVSAARERLHRSIGQKARYAKAMIAFEVDQMLAQARTRPPLPGCFNSVVWYGIREAAISDEKIGRRRWDADQSSQRIEGVRHGEGQEADQDREGRQGREEVLT